MNIEAISVRASVIIREEPPGQFGLAQRCWAPDGFLDNAPGKLANPHRFRMLHLLRQSLVASAACVGFYFLTRELLGPIVWLPLAVLIGALFSRILIETAAELGWQLRRHAVGPMSGKRYRFQSTPLHVIECDEYCRWIRSDDIRLLLNRLPNDATLQRLFPVGFAHMGKLQRGYVRDDALLIYLAQANSPLAIRFKVWVERNVAAPAQKIRRQKGIYIAALDAPALPDITNA